MTAPLRHVLPALALLALLTSCSAATPEPSGTPSERASATSTVGVPEQTRPPRAASTTASVPDVGTVPAVVCKDLQFAQDTMQAAGFYMLDSEDGTGAGRMQVLDRNWVVIKQRPRAGTRTSVETPIMLTAVKHGEPDGGAC